MNSFGNSFGLTDNFRNNAASIVNQMGSQKTFDRSNPEAKPTMFNFTSGTSSPNSFGGFMPQQAPNAASSPASSPVNPYMPQQGGPANGSRGYEQDKGDGWGGGYGVDRSSPLGGSVGDTGNMFGNAVMGLHNYGNIGFAPGSMFAKIAADMLNDKATQATAVSARDALASQIAADRTFGGGGFGGIGGMTSPTGAGIAANPMGRDPAQAMGEFYGGYFGGGRDPNSAG